MLQSLGTHIARNNLTAVVWSLLAPVLWICICGRMAQ